MSGVTTAPPAVVLVGVVFVLVATGVYLVLERSLTRVLVGVILLGNGINVLFLVASGRAGSAPLVGSSDPEDMSDSLPQAFVLTAIVITLGLTAFLLAMAYRSWQLHGHDEVQDDVEDRLVRDRAVRDETSGSYDPDDSRDDRTDTGEDAADTTVGDTASRTAGRAARPAPRDGGAA